MNFRDFGGLETRSGGCLRRFMLYRSGHLATLSPLALKALLGLDLAVIADLRYADERLRNASPWPAAYAERVLAHDEDRSQVAPHLTLGERAFADPSAVHGFYLDYYRALPFNRHYRPLFAEVLITMSRRGGPVLVHCTAGKDRTGILVALIQHALGVPREAVMSDYLKSRDAPGLRLLGEPIRERVVATLGAVAAAPIVDAVLGVERDYLTAAFAAIEGQYGSVDAYLCDMGVTDAVRHALVDRFVESCEA